MRTLTAIVPAGITNATELFNVLATQLRFPAYFGRNWDALFDCLCDFSWLAEPTQVVIRHSDVPCLPAGDRDVYLNVLRDAIDSWRLEPRGHKLEVSFPDAEFTNRVNGHTGGAAVPTRRLALICGAVGVLHAAVMTLFAAGPELSPLVVLMIDYPVASFTTGLQPEWLALGVPIAACSILYPLILFLCVWLVIRLRSRAATSSEI